MPEYVVESLKLAPGAGAVILAVFVAGYFLRNFIDAKIKSTVELEYNKRLAEFENKLRIDAASHQIQFSALHVEMAKVIAEVYAKLIVFRRQVGEFTKFYVQGGEPSIDERRNAAHKAYREFVEYFSSHAVYLPAETVAIARQIEDILTETAMDYDRLSKSDSEIAFTSWQATYRKLTEVLPPLVTELENNFRSLLGHDWVLPTKPVGERSGTTK